MRAVSKPFVGYYISMDVIVALMFDNCLGTARFSSVKYKASSNAFPIYRFPSLSLHPLGFGILASRWSQASIDGAVLRTIAKIRKISEKDKLLAKKNKKTFLQGLRKQKKEANTSFILMSLLYVLCHICLYFCYLILIIPTHEHSWHSCQESALCESLLGRSPTLLLHPWDTSCHVPSLVHASCWGMQKLASW